MRNAHFFPPRERFVNYIKQKWFVPAQVWHNFSFIHFSSLPTEVKILLLIDKCYLIAKQKVNTYVYINISCPGFLESGKTRARQQLEHYKQISSGNDCSIGEETSVQNWGQFLIQHGQWTSGDLQLRSKLGVGVGVVSTWKSTKRKHQGQGDSG